MKHFYTLDTLGTLDTLSTGPTTDEECKNSNEAKILQTKLPNLRFHLNGLFVVSRWTSICFLHSILRFHPQSLFYYTSWQYIYTCDLSWHFVFVDAIFWKRANRGHFSATILQKKCRLQRESNSDCQNEGEHTDHLTTTITAKILRSFFCFSYIVS